MRKMLVQNWSVKHSMLMYDWNNHSHLRCFDCHAFLNTQKNVLITAESFSWLKKLGNTLQPWWITNLIMPLCCFASSTMFAIVSTSVVLGAKTTVTVCWCSRFTGRALQMEDDLVIAFQLLLCVLGFLIKRCPADALQPLYRKRSLSVPFSLPPPPPFPSTMAMWWQSFYNGCGLCCVSAYIYIYWWTDIIYWRTVYIFVVRLYICSLFQISSADI